MIAHRLQTIKSADNLLYLESPNNVIGAAKGTAEYDAVMAKMMETNYAHQADKNKDDGEGSDTFSSEELSEEEVPTKKAKLSAEEFKRMATRRESKRIGKEIKRNSKLTPA